MLEKEIASYIWVHSNSLIKNLTLFEDDAEIRLLNFLMQSIYKQKQPEGTFIKMASPKIDFYVEVFKKLKNLDSKPKYSLLAGDTNQASIFSPCIRYK